MSTPRDAALDATRGWAASWHVHWTQLGRGLPNGVLQLLQQEIKDDGETGGLPLGNILERNLTPIEVVNHGVHGHTALLRAGWRHGQARVTGHRGTADGRRAVTAAEGAYPTQLGRGRVGALGHVLQRGTQMEDGCGPDL